MFRPFELFIGLRYLRARRRNQYVSFISLMSLLGIALGVAALIVIISVMNGFENELRFRLLSATSHASVLGEAGDLDRWQEVREQALAMPEVVAAAPFVEFESMLAYGRELTPAKVRGVLPKLEASVSRISESMLAGSLADLTSGGRGVVLGRLLALRLGVTPGDSITLMVPQAGNGGHILTPELWRFTVTGLFEVGMQEHDGVLALINLDDAVTLRHMTPGRVTGLRLDTGNLFRAPATVKRLVTVLGQGYKSTDWTQENASYFRAVAIEKTMMAVLLFLIVGVAAFNIVATLVMVVTDKRSEIAILRTVGATPRSVVFMFMAQGIVIGLVGTLLGVIIGVLLALNVETLAPQLETLFGFQIFPSDVYYISRIPSDLRVSNVVSIGLVTFVLTMLSTLYPSFRAARTQPAEALRYD